MPSSTHAPIPHDFAEHPRRFTSHFRIGVLASALAAATFALTGCGTNISTQVTSTTGTITASTATLDVGSSIIGSPTNGTSVSFTNNGSKDVAFTASPLSGGEFQVVSTTCGSTLAAGKSCGVTVNFTPTAPGTRTSTLTGGGNGQSVTITLRGTGLKPAALTASVATLVFPDTLIGTASGVQQVTYSNGGDVAAPIVLGLQGSFQQSSSTCTQAVAPQSSCYVTLAFLPTARGTNKGSLTATMGASTATTVLNGTGMTPAHVTINPAALEFSDTAVQSMSGPVAVTLANDGDMDSPPSAISVTKDFTLVSNGCARTLPGRSQCVFQLAFAPGSVGSKTGTASVVAGSATLSIPISGTAFTPSQVTLSPASLNFAATQVGTSSSASRITLTNTGDHAARLQIAAAPTDFQYGQTDCSGSLAGHAQCSIAVVFAPASSGNKGGVLSVATDTGNITAALTGSATGAAHVQVSPVSASFPDVLTGQSSTAMPFTFTNTGDVAAGMGSMQVSSSFVLGSNTCGTTLAAHASCTAAVVFQPGTSGSKTGTLTVQAGADMLQASFSGNATAPAQAPVLQAVSPSAITPGTPTTVHVTGTGLDTIDTMFIDGVATAYNRVSATEVTFNANPSAWALQPLTIVVHAPGNSGNSNGLTLQVTPAPVTYDAAVRFTQQAAMSTTADQIAQVQNRGFSGWIDWQMTTTMYPYQNNHTDMLYNTYLNNALQSNYALRQRVTLALKQVFTYGIADACGITQCGHFWEARLQQDAFGNVRTLIGDVATSPLMGAFLQNANNFTSYPWTGTSRANANFARELMQLMTIGPYKLNRDGSQVLDSNGLPLSAYSEANVLEAAAAMSGWTWADLPLYSFLLNGNPLLPMKPLENYHSPLAKNILPGVTLPAGQTATKDMNDVLDTLFQHPNIAPFLCRRMIQHLVTSNPSPAYMTRIVSVFEDNGKGVRGDMAAIVKAILLDPEARRGDDPTGPYTQTETRFIEPLLYISNAVAATGATFTDDQIQNVTNALGEDPYMSKTVFGAFSPDNKLPTGQYAPETQLLNDAASLQKVAFATNVARGTQPGLIGDLSASPLWNAASPAALVEQMNHFLFHGTMPASLRTALTTLIADRPGKTANQLLPDMLVIALNASAYQVMH